jgi:Zn finger protein HypA/HybF involved in hydrogenase expression
MDADRYTHEIEVKIMCMVGDVPEINIENIEMDLKEYVCLDCENKFKGLGKSVICPACKSSNIEMVSAEK